MLFRISSNYNHVYCRWLIKCSTIFSPVVASTGRHDRVFQILPEQEEAISVGDMLSDGILIVEYEDNSLPLEGMLVNMHDSLI